MRLFRRTFIFSLITLAPLLFSGLAPVASAQTVTELQAQIASLQQQIATLTAQLTSLQQLLGTQPSVISGSSFNYTFTHNLFRSVTDATTGGEVSNLQRLLASDASVYPEGLITGFYGALTEQAVQRFQAKRGIVSSGTPETTGYGAVGPKTRAALNALSGTQYSGTPTFLLSAPNILTVVPPPGGDGMATATITVTPFGSASSGLVTVFFETGLPAGTSIGPYVSCNAPCAAPLNFTVTSAATPGTYPIKIKGKTSGYETEIGFNLVVSSFRPFTFRATSSNVFIQKPYVGNASVTSTATFSLLSGTSEAVVVSQSGFPSGVTASTSAPCAPSCSIQNTITVGAVTATGTYPIAVIASGTTAAASTTYNLIIAAPEPASFNFSLSASRNISVLERLSGTALASNTINVGWVSGMPQPVTFLQTGMPPGVTVTSLPACAPPCSRVNYITVSPTVASGTYPITVDAQGGGAANTIIYNITIRGLADATPPTVTLTSSVTSTTPGHAVTFTASSSDNVRVSKVEFYDGPTLKNSDTISPYTYSWTPSSTNIGIHAWAAKAYDGAGNSTISAPVIITVLSTSTTSTSTTNTSTTSQDTIPPTPSITAPSANTTVSGSAVTLFAAASDNVGVIGVQFQIDGVSLGSLDTTVPYTTLWDTRTVANGFHTITALAHDAAQNIGTSAISVIVANSTTSTTTGLLPDVLSLYSGLTWGSAAATTWYDPASGAPLSGYRAIGNASFSDFDQFITSYYGIVDYYDPKLTGLGWENYFYNSLSNGEVWEYASSSSRIILTTQTPNLFDSQCPCSLQLTVFTGS